ncbi:TIGR02569 family protein [Goodfellowiella coeruleoviolacea]|uniref:TIGR02569 family protein n=1 Tax=Goodfellowiella coeruleoviolacea TaxID=334858 RepID=A0AAE3GJQ7_9PSEU|nr:TIGR02569 family protein [Goodfellowiella coeruleoviolacea]MCP2168813.1 TIGR02569 family protein [Goodfellowiella coeruleoviolacea]
MSDAAVPPPAHVRAAFGARAAEPELIDGGPAWRCGDVALKPAGSPAEAAWVATTLDTLNVPDLRLGRPVRSTDGRWVVGGWAAMKYVSGRAEPRHDEVVAVSVRLHQATADLPRPRFLAARTDVFALADRCAWGETSVPLDHDRGGRLFDVLAAARRPISLKPQVVHGDLFGNVLFSGSAPPAIIDFVPYWRPAEWAAAVIVVDALAWGGADQGILLRWTHLPEWPQALLRALLFRLAVHALHPSSTAQSLRGLDRAAHQITRLL